MPAITPVQLFPGYAFDADEELITIPRSSVDNVPVASLNATTGNGGVLLRGMVYGAFGRYGAIPAADRPTRWTMARGTQTASPNLLNALRTPFTLQFDVTSATFELAQE